MALMRRVLPLSTCAMVLSARLLDPPGLLDYAWSPQRAALIAFSGLAAFFVNWSGFLVMGACSALTHTILGQLKASFGTRPLEPDSKQNRPPKAASPSRPAQGEFRHPSPRTRL